MAFNFIESIKSTFSTDASANLASATGETPLATQRALDLAVPEVVGSLSAHASTESGAASLMSQLSGAGSMSDISGKLGSSSGATQLLGSSTEAASRLFGSALGPISETISRQASIRGGSATSLLGVVAAAAMSILGKKAKDDNLSAGGLRDLLSEQRRFLKSEPVFEKEVLNPEWKRKGMGRMWPLAIAALALLGLLFWRARPRHIVSPEQRAAVHQPYQLPITQAPKVTPPPTPKVVEPVKEQPAPAAEGPAIGGSGPAMGVAGLSAALNSKSPLPQSFELRGLEFQKGSSDLTPQSADVVKSLANTLKEHPTARIRVESHTDGIGSADTNRELSERQANAVKTALTEDGVSADRVETEGFGAARPAASNENPEGRQQNRRTEVILLAR